MHNSHFDVWILGDQPILSLLESTFELHFEFDIGDIFLRWLNFWCIGYLFILRIDIPSCLKSFNDSSGRYDLKYTHKHESEKIFIKLNSIAQIELEESYVFP